MQTESLTDASHYKCWTSVPLRYSDTDALGHVNNAVFSTLLEQGRVATFFNGMDALSGAGKTFVIASMKLDFLAEMNFPGTAEIGTRINSFGKSSVKIGQVIYLNGKCCAVSHEVMVLIDEKTRRPVLISEDTRKLIEERISSKD
ncbi:MAG: acyl-CoA thioesterase [Cyanobacteria bacterium TGS_CYA1]|nr:acyl-CoA thioesterase [Cyanobacteria bacterium TGS_CYA1]